MAALADPTRRMVFEHVANAERSVGEIASELPVSRPAVSQHLRVLKEAGLVSEHQVGTRRYYRARPEGLADLRTYVERFWKDALTSFKEAAEKGKP